MAAGGRPLLSGLKGANRPLRWLVSSSSAVGRLAGFIAKGRHRRAARFRSSANLRAFADADGHARASLQELPPPACRKLRPAVIDSMEQAQ